MENWQPPPKDNSIISRLATQALRAQRIIVAKKLLHMEQMVQIHAPALAKQPGGLAQIEKLKTQFADARRKLLQGETDG